MEKLTLHFRQYESCYVTVVPVLLPVREIYNRNTIEGGERERERERTWIDKVRKVRQEGDGLQKVISQI
jgi:hypothetical protein